MKKFSAIIISLLISAGIFADTKIHYISSEDQQFRKYDSVLEVSGTINSISKFYGLPYQESIPISDYGNISMETAFNAYKELADQGNKEAQWIIGVAYEHGSGVQVDPDEALRYLKLSFENGYLPAGYTLARLISVEYEDPFEAADYLKKAAATNIPYILNFYATHCTYPYTFKKAIPEDLDKAAELYAKSAEAGNPRGTFDLGYIYVKQKKNIDEAEQLFIKAAEAGYTEAYRLLTSIFYCPSGLKPDKEKARNATIKFNTQQRIEEKKYNDEFFEHAEYLEKLANEGDIYAMQYLGENYSIFDKSKSIEWTEKAADAGNSQACVAAAKRYIAGQYVDQDLNKAIKYLKASGLKTREAKSELLQLYAYALFIHPYLNEWEEKHLLYKRFFYPDRRTDYRVINQKEAFMYFKHCADEGDQEAIAALAYCYEKGIVTKKNHAKALKYNFENFDLVPGNTKETFYENLADSLNRNKKQAEKLEKEIENLLQSEKADPSEKNKAELAEYYLDLAYYKAESVTKGNRNKILSEYYNKAAEYGSSSALEILAHSYRTGEYSLGSYEDNQKKAFELLKQAADLKNTSAITDLAYMYELNPYIEQDFDKAIMLYREGLKYDSSRGRSVYALSTYGEDIPEEYQEKKESHWWE